MAFRTFWNFIYIFNPQENVWICGFRTYEYEGPTVFIKLYDWEWDAYFNLLQMSSFANSPKLIDDTQKGCILADKISQLRGNEQGNF